MLLKSLTDPQQILTAVERLEESQLQSARRRTRESINPTQKTLLLLHTMVYPFAELVGTESVTLYSDATTRGGMRTVRIHFSKMRMVERNDMSDETGKERSFDVFSSLVFDAAGTLIALHVDLPWS